MTKNEILETLLKSILNSRIESLERDEVSHIADLKLCNEIIKECDSII